MNFIIVDLEDFISQLQLLAADRGWVKIADLCAADNRSGAHNSQHNQKSQNQVHGCSGCDYQDFLPWLFVAECPIIRAFLVFAFHRNISPDWKQSQRILGLPFCKVAQLWPHTDGEFRHTDANCLCRQKMAQLVDHNNDAKN